MKNPRPNASPARYAIAGGVGVRSVWLVGWWVRSVGGMAGRSIRSVASRELRKSLDECFAPTMCGDCLLLLRSRVGLMWQAPWSKFGGAGVGGVVERIDRVAIISWRAGASQ
jgi:hypothetical protein